MEASLLVIVASASSLSDIIDLSASSESASLLTPPPDADEKSLLELALRTEVSA